MILERENLEAMTTKQLFALSYEVGCVIDNPMAPKDTIIAQLLVHSAQEPASIDASRNALEGHTKAKQAFPVAVTIEQLKDALNPFILKGMKLFYNKDDATWLIRVRLKNIRIRDSLTGEERFIERYRDDSGTMNQPLETIRRCARVLMQGAPTAQEVKEPAILLKEYEAIA